MNRAWSPAWRSWTEYVYTPELAEGGDDVHALILGTGFNF